MARVKTKFPGQDRGRTDFSEWCDGQIWELKKGEDFDISVDPEAMRQRAINWAKHENCGVRTSVSRDRSLEGDPKMFVTLQFYPDQTYGFGRRKKAGAKR